VAKKTSGTIFLSCTSSLGDKTFREFKGKTKIKTKLKMAYVITLLIEAFFVP
jgi:hypothetical protein